MITGIAHIATTAQNMEESLRFYTSALGFQKAFELPKPEDGSPWIIYLVIAPGQFLELFYGGTEPNPWKPELIGFSHLSFTVDDINATCKQITDAGYRLDSPPKQGSDKNWQAWVTDPDGMRIELMQISPDSPQAKFS